MAERDALLEALVAEVLGPRGGTHEVLRADEDPLDEYIAGVLAPHRASSVEIAEGEDDLIGDDESLADDQADPGQGITPGSIDPASLPTPALDPRSRPASLGLSFTVRGAAPAIDVCCTWARYGQASGGGWQRRPHGQVWRHVSCSADASFTPATDPAIAIHVRVQQSADRRRVSIFLINTTSFGERAETHHHIFQPQIRVAPCAGTELVPIDEDHARRDDPDEDSLALLYRGKRSFARGHLCSATWKAIDPERPHPHLPAPSTQPFCWTDGPALFDATTCAGFSPADVRSEYLPVFPVNSPEKGWQGDLLAPELNPGTLAELWDPTAMQNALEPLAIGYEGWIRARQKESQSLAGAELTVAQSHLASCQHALNRLREGISLLESNDDVRLAFCFANRAMAIQSQWTKKQVNSWWPFQLAFQLINLPALADRTHTDRNTCDLLWFPTGGGKTEAYLGLAAFTMAYRRLLARRSNRGDGGTGVAVLSRYTLRLLTIQQFRRALASVTACELLRVDRSQGSSGWRPRSCPDHEGALWGTERFSAGLWVGGGVTPNHLQDFQYKDRSGRLINVRGALAQLEGRAGGEGEPAQVLTCPACESILAVSRDGFQRGETFTLHIVLGDASTTSPAATQLNRTPFDVRQAAVTTHSSPRFCTLTMAVALTDEARPETIDSWIRDHVVRAMGSNAWHVAARGSRPGYFIRTARLGRSTADKPLDFEIFCPNPDCDLSHGIDWEESTLTGPRPPIAAFMSPQGRGTRCPIPALTVDDQIYQWCPSMVVATVDKFARLSFEPRAGVLFGNVDGFNEHLGYYRRWCPSQGPASLPSTPQQAPRYGRNMPADSKAPPDLILQDELHLIEGPLGSMVGLYESAVDQLASTTNDGRETRAKYIASTATVRSAEAQVGSLFVRDLQIFPPPGLSVDNSFFAYTEEAHPLDTTAPGRLYVGICAPGRGAQTPIVRIWSRLLQHVQDRRGANIAPDDLDPFWTLVGYFNATRELAGAVALARQDIIQRLSTISTSPRPLDQNEPLELSSRADSMRLPSLLNQLQISLSAPGSAVNIAVATSMFGTGVDVDRLGLMVVNGQPKTTSSYIQATGRVGRRHGGLVATFFRASRPRDLNHYEFFCAYHASLYRFVEPVTVSPFAPRARDRGLGPVAVALLRQAATIDDANGSIAVNERWRIQQRIQGGIHCLAHNMDQHRRDADVAVLPSLLERRAQTQPGLRRPPSGDTETHAASELDIWQQLAARTGTNLVYWEATLINPPSRPVVLGDLAHQVAQTGVAYEDAPNSLRDIESTVTIRGWS